MTDLWLFGYGSIMWKTGFDYSESRLAFVSHRARRFWQASKDHRGTEGYPGRVVTLIHSPGDQCWGMAYRIPAERVSETVERLDRRESGGYTRETIEMIFDDGSSVDGLTYNAAEDNPNYLGHADPGLIASQIAASHGPSGSNKEYILRLARALADHNILDEHIRELADRVRNIKEQKHENY